MRNFFLLFLALGLISISCTDDLQREIDDLKGKVDAIENAIVGLEFDGNDLVATMGDGTTTTVTAPDGISPNYVVDFQIDTEENLITITFADGTTAEYMFYTSGGNAYLSTTLSGDYGISSITMGDVMLAEFSYDDQFRMVNALINIPDGRGNVINVADLQNNYSDAEPTAIAITKAADSRIDYNYEESYSYGYAYFPGDSGYTFAQEDGDMYKLYVNRYWDGSQYRYNEYEHCWFVLSEDIDWDLYTRYFPVPDEDSSFYRCNNNYYSMELDGEYGYMFYASNKIKVTQVYAAGETMDTLKTRLTMRSDDLIEKVEMMDDEGSVREYFELNYDDNALLTHIDLYFVDGKEVTDPSKKSISEDDGPEEFNYGTIHMVYTSGLVTSMHIDIYNEDGEVDETVEFGELVYDDAGNPVEVWTSNINLSGSDYNYTVDDNGVIIIEPFVQELVKVVEIEYNYTLPNFFGKTLEYLVPELKGLTINNAPTKIIQSGFFNFAEMEYSDFNEGGYPANVKLDASFMQVGIRKSAMKSSPLPMGSEIDLEYTKFE